MREWLLNYKPKGELVGIPIDIIDRMLDNQLAQGNPEDISVFENIRSAGSSTGGFNWSVSLERNLLPKEGMLSVYSASSFWDKILDDKNFNVFYELYPKQEKTITIGEED